MGILYALPKSIDKTLDSSTRNDITVGDVILFNTKWDKQSSTVTLNEKYDKIKNRSFPAFAASPKENLLIEQCFDESIKSFTGKDIFTDSHKIRKYIDELDIESIFNTYKIVISDKKIVNHYDQIYHTVVKTIETKDPYIRTLFPLGETGDVWDYSYGDEIYTDYIDSKSIKFNIQKATSLYSKFDHYNFLLKMKSDNQMDAIIRDDLVKKYWPLDYFKKLSENIPKRDVKAFINGHNNEILYAAFPDIMAKFCVL